MRRVQAIFAALTCAALATALACNKSAAHAPTDVKDTFSHACATDDDCVVVFFGGTCGFCNESNGAIAKKDRDAYQKAYNAARENCPQEHAVGECAAFYGVSQCNAAKTCTYVTCRSTPKDEHHCQEDGG
jgi:hypothetical protein